MTDKQIEERCHRWLDHPDNMVHKSVYGNVYPSQKASLESLCREMIAEGLERAAASCDREAECNLDERSYYARSFGDWCRQEAERVKGGG